MAQVLQPEGFGVLGFRDRGSWISGFMGLGLSKLLRVWVPISFGRNVLSETF